MQSELDSNQTDSKFYRGMNDKKIAPYVDIQSDVFITNLFAYK